LEQLGAEGRRESEQKGAKKRRGSEQVSSRIFESLQFIYLPLPSDSDFKEPFRELQLFPRIFLPQLGATKCKLVQVAATAGFHIF
jgi:hypothetical protein